MFSPKVLSILQKGADMTVSEIKYLVSTFRYGELIRMDLSKLFKMQDELDKLIVDEKGLHGQDLLDKKILALLVELGELANEVRSWKFWSNDQLPRTRVLKNPTMNDEDKVYENRVLGEYADGLHFVLSVGLELEFDGVLPSLSVESLKLDDIVRQMSALMQTDWGYYDYGRDGYYLEGLELFLGLGNMLGFTWPEIEQAYCDKHAENIRRQANGY